MEVTPGVLWVFSEGNELHAAGATLLCAQRGLFPEIFANAAMMR
jgi:hypothetical protein